MKKLSLFSLIVFLIIGKVSLAQDTLPNFSVRNVGNNRIVIGWHNNFDVIKQVSIQRSFDSLKNFKTILTVVDPSLPENGYLDTKAANGHMFYRLYILLDKGSFLFSNTKKPIFDSLIVVKKDTVINNDTVAYDPGMPGTKMRMIRADNPSLVQAIPGDSVVIGPVVLNKPKTETWVPSKSVFTTKDGAIRITLPDDATKKYDIKFYTLREEFLFELKDIKERNFKLDKATFYHAGWFKFELYENDVLKEKNRFYLAKEF